MGLYQLAFEAELRQLRRQWVFPKEPASAVFFMGTLEEANARLVEYVLRELFDLHGSQTADRRRFQETVQRYRGCLGIEGQTLVSEVYEVIGQREAARRDLERFRRLSGSNVRLADELRQLDRELEELVSADFLSRYRRPVIQALPHILKALAIRGARLYASPEKDRRKRELVAVHETRRREMEAVCRSAGCDTDLEILEEYRWMLEEWKVAVFAPEVKTRFRVSSKRLEEQWRAWREHRRMQHGG